VIGMAHSVTRPPAGGPYDADGQPAARFHQLDPERQLGTSVWLARADGDLVAARAATAAAFDPDAGDRDAALARVATLVSLRSAHLVPLLGLAEREGATWLVSGYVEGVPLSRLLGAATLTPVQAGYLAHELFLGLAWLHESGVPHGRLTGLNVQVGVDGEPRFTDWTLASLAQARGFDEAVAEDLVALRSLVADLQSNADRPVVRHRGTYNDLMAALERTGRGLDVESAAATADRLGHALLAVVGDSTSMAGTRSEIGTLVATLARRSAPNGRPHAQARPAPTPVPRVLPDVRLSEADWHRGRPRRWLRRGVAALVVAAVLAGGYVFARQPVADLADRLLNRHEAPTTGHPSPKPSAPTSTSTPGGTTGHVTPTPRAVPTLAPSSSDPVTAVTIRPIASCAAGSTCLVRATARITPAGQAREVVVQIAVVNRCTGRVRTFPAGTVTAQPGWTYVFVTTPVSLPRARSLAAVAVTTTPARAASPPLLVPASGGSC